MTELEKTLAYLHLRKLLGDMFVDNIQSKNNDINQIIKIDNKPIVQNNKTILSAQDISKIQKIESFVSKCNLCEFSKLVKNNQRFCNFLPTEKKLANHDANKPFPMLALVVESLNFSNLTTNYNNPLEILEQNNSNTMLSDIIQKALGFSVNSVFIFQLFKCAQVAGNDSINNKIQREEIERQTQACSGYLINQLELVDYAIFFGKRLCKLFFNIELSESKGRLLQYKVSNSKTINAVCIPDLYSMIVSPKLKKEAMINFTILKNIMN